MSSVIGFMNSIWGRAARIILGLALMAYGYFVLGGTVGIIVAVVGILPILLGLWGRCLFELFTSSPRSA